MMTLIRWFLRKLILFFDSTFPPKQLERTPEKQAQLDHLAQTLVLYQFEACPFCVKVRRAQKRLGLKIQLKDAKTESVAAELVKGGGELQVPCLRITESSGSVRWLYESASIITYLEAL